MPETYTVQRGDTLWGIAQRFLGNGTLYTQLAAINGISNPNLIYVGQVIRLTNNSGGGGGGTGGGGGSNNQVVSNSKAVINQFGLQSDSDGLLFATWTWNAGNTENYETIWYYDTGDNHWFVGSESTTTHKESTYNIPSNAKRVKFKVKPVSKTHTVNNTEVSYWTADWSTEKIYDVSSSPPSTPSTPSVTIDKYKLTAELDNLDVNATHIQFQIVRDDSIVFNTGTAKIITNHAAYSCSVEAGGLYKVRCRAMRDNKYSDWSEYSSNVGTIPATPAGLTTCRANSTTSVYLEWAAVNAAKTYDIEYATQKTYFDGSDQTTVVSGIEFTHYEKTGLETGQEYFFRIRAVNDAGSSAWSEAKSVSIGKEPAAPTTWSSTTTAITGEQLTLYWVHNAADNSSQTYAELELIINGLKETHTIKNTTDEDEKDKTSSFIVNTSSYTEGTKILWRVRTAGVTKAYGDWSIQRTVDVYAPPTLELRVTDVNENPIDTLTSFPFYVYALAGPKTQVPIGYHLTVISNDTYETVDNIGNKKTVNTGEQIYSKYFDTTDALLVEMSAGNIDLENNMRYTVSCLVTMNSGLTVTQTKEITVSWAEFMYEPNAEISVDQETLVAYIRPYCEQRTLQNRKVAKNPVVRDSNGEKILDSSGSNVSTDTFLEGVDLYILTDEIFDSVYGNIVVGLVTETGETICKGITGDGEDVYYSVIEDCQLIDGVTLSVYRREFDGTFVELATGLENSKNIFITDPHPSLDFARYRIVAVTKTTGAVSYYDVPGYPVNEKAAIIQWDEEWSSFDTPEGAALEKPPWAGSMLKLPYNIDVSDSHSQDVSLIEYIGRKYPVSYYGTQLGKTAIWNTDVVHGDKETLYALRRLAIWMGDVYVREPSGSGYWANISVSFNQKHCDLKIPVTLNIKQVEGGI